MAFLLKRARVLSEPATVQLFRRLTPHIVRLEATVTHGAELTINALTCHWNRAHET